MAGDVFPPEAFVIFGIVIPAIMGAAVLVVALIFKKADNVR